MSISMCEYIVQYYKICVMFAFRTVCKYTQMIAKVITHIRIILVIVNVLYIQNVRSLLCCRRITDGIEESKRKYSYAYISTN